jgi:transcriptional regulator with XRE-family HTH domain
MQARDPPEATSMETRGYNLGGMSRKLSTPRPKQGAKLAALRRNAGLTQAELARMLGEHQQTVAYWEKSTRPPRSDVLPKLAKIFKLPVDALLNDKVALETDAHGPTGGKVQQLFREVAKLPRRQQDKVVEFVSAFIDQYKRKAS